MPPKGRPQNGNRFHRWQRGRGPREVLRAVGCVTEDHYAARMNETLLRRTMNFIARHPESFEPTIADFGGWAVLLDNPSRRPPDGEPDGRGGWIVTDSWMVEGRWMPAFAQCLLGITFEQRRVLFHYGITVSGLQAVVDDLVLSSGGSDPGDLYRIAQGAGSPMAGAGKPWKTLG
jgi:hypothetical protein